MSSRLKIGSLASIIALFLLSGCVTIYNPATQRNEMLLIDTPSEIALGRDMDKQIRKKFEIFQDPYMQHRLEYIGNRVSAFSDRQDLTYHFSIIKDNELNAFAIPGGFIYVNKGVMDIATDDELACVLAHEIGHIAAKHSVKKLQTVLGYQIIMGIALGLSGQQAMAKAMDVVFGLVNLGYGRKDEFFADKLSVKYAKKSGFNPYGMVTFFEKLEKEASSKPSHHNLVFLSSHPPINERVKQIKKEIELNQT